MIEPELHDLDSFGWCSLENINSRESSPRKLQFWSPSWYFSWLSWGNKHEYCETWILHVENAIWVISILFGEHPTVLSACTYLHPLPKYACMAISREHRVCPIGKHTRNKPLVWHPWRLHTFARRTANKLRFKKLCTCFTNHAMTKFKRANWIYKEHTNVIISLL